MDTPVQFSPAPPLSSTPPVELTVEDVVTAIIQEQAGMSRLYARGLAQRLNRAGCLARNYEKIEG